MRRLFRTNPSFQCSLLFFRHHELIGWFPHAPSIAQAKAIVNILLRQYTSFGIFSQLLTSGCPFLRLFDLGVRPASARGSIPFGSHQVERVRPGGRFRTQDSDYCCCAFMASAIFAFRASRLKLAPFCMGGYSMAVWASLPTCCWTNTNRQNSYRNQFEVILRPALDPVCPASRCARRDPGAGW